MKNKFNFFVILTLMISFGLACSGGNQQAEANKIVEEANKKIEESRELMTKTDVRAVKLFSANVQTTTQMAEYKAKMKDEAKSIADDFEKVVQMLKEVSKKFEDASKLNVVDKYKEYAKLKSDEFAKRAEAISAHKGNSQAFIDINDPKEMFGKFDENNKKSEGFMKEAEDLSAKAKKMEEENKDLFKQI